MKVKEESEKVGLKLNIKKIKIMASSPITSRQIDGETMETLTAFIFFWFLRKCQKLTLFRFQFISKNIWHLMQVATCIRRAIFGAVNHVTFY